MVAVCACIGVSGNEITCGFKKDYCSSTVVVLLFTRKLDESSLLLYGANEEFLQSQYRNENSVIVVVLFVVRDVAQEESCLCLVLQLNKD